MTWFEWLMPKVAVWLFNGVALALVLARIFMFGEPVTKPLSEPSVRYWRHRNQAETELARVSLGWKKQVKKRNSFVLFIHALSCIKTTTICHFRATTLKQRTTCDSVYVPWVVHSLFLSLIRCLVLCGISYDSLCIAYILASGFPVRLVASGHMCLLMKYMDRLRMLLLSITSYISCTSLVCSMFIHNQGIKRPFHN